MTHIPYKFEKYMEPDFPVYTSYQKDIEVLAYTHYHKAAEIILVESGKVHVRVGTKFFDCEQNDIIFIPAQTVHEVTGTAEQSAIRAIVFDLSILASNYIHAKFQELFNMRPKLYPVISPEHMFYKEIRNYTMLVLDTYDKHTLYNKMQIASYLMLIASHLIQAYAIADSETNQNNVRLRPVFQYIEEHLAEKIYVSDLSALIYTCDKQLLRLFKAVTGESPTNYILNLRIETALKLLVSTDLSIAAIAEKTGFGSVNYMDRVFRKKLHISPLDYRRGRVSTGNK